MSVELINISSTDSHHLSCWMLVPKNWCNDANRLCDKFVAFVSSFRCCCFSLIVDGLSSLSLRASLQSNLNIIAKSLGLTETFRHTSGDLGATGSPVMSFLSVCFTCASEHWGSRDSTLFNLKASPSVVNHSCWCASSYTF